MLDSKSEVEQWAILRDIIDALPFYVMIVDETHHVITANEAVRKSLGADPDAIVGTFCPKAVHGMDTPYHGCPLEEAVEKGHSIVKEMFFEETQKWVKSTAYLTNKRTKDGKQIFIHTIQDINERKKNEESLRESEKKFKALAEESPNMIFINKKGQVVYANKKCEEIMGYARDEFYSKNFDFMTLIASESRDFVKENMLKHMMGEEIPPYEYTLLTKDGREITAIHNTKLIDFEGEKAILGIITDVTEHKQAEEELLQEKQRLADVTSHVNCGLLLLDNQAKVTYANRVAEDWFGPSDKISGKFCWELFKLKDPEKECAGLNVLRTGRTVQGDTFARIVNGEDKFFYTVASPIKNDSGKIRQITEVVFDLTEHKKNEEKLQENIEELEKWQRLTVGREVRMVELKKEIKELKEKLGKHESRIR
jgi:PAS domain S-box-containing protein